MSKFTQAIHAVAAFFSAAVHDDSPLKSQTSAAADALQNAADHLEAALPLVADDVANYALSKLGPLGTMMSPLVDAFLERLIARLLQRHSSPTAGANAAIQLLTAPQGSGPA